MELSSEKLKKPKTIAITIASETDLDMFFAAFALSQSLKTLGKNVIFTYPQNKLIKKKLQHMGQEAGKETAERVYEIELPRKEFAIKNVTLDESGSTVKIRFETTSPLDEKRTLNVHEQKAEPDLIVHIGSNKPENTDQKELLIIAYEEPEPKYRDSFWHVKTTSISESVFSLLSGFGLSFSDNTATSLISGILWKSDSLKIVKAPVVFETINKLITAGGDYKTAVKLGVNNQTFMHTKLYSEIYNNIVAAGKGIYYSTVNAPQQTNEGSYLRNYVPISEIFNCNAAFVIETNEGNCKVYFRSNSNQIDLKKICQEYGGSASEYEGFFSSTIKPEDLAPVIVEKLKKQLDGENDQSQPATNEQKTESQAQQSEAKAAENPDPLAPANSLPTPLNINSENGKIESS